MSKRSRDPLDDPKSGPSKNQLRGLSYVGQKPAFLQNALAALQGGTRKQQPQFDSNGRPTIPTRPGGGEGSAGEEESEDEQDEWDLGGGDEAPTVVVLKEGKHLGKDEVDRLRAQGTSITESTAPEESTKSKGSLSFSSGTKSKSKTGAGPNESWDDVVKRSKSEAEAKQQAKEEKAVDAAKVKEKDEKRKKKEKKEAKKKIGMLSFDDE